MISLFLVGDGIRDEVTVPPLLEHLSGRDVKTETREWGNVRVRGGYPGKLKFVVREAIKAGASGVVAVVDRDKETSGDRLKKLKQGRTDDRQKLLDFPTALGEAAPHGEAWLLDDPVAVQTALRLPTDVMIVNVRKTKDPKGEIEALRQASPRRDEGTLDLLRDIARVVDSSRCRHANETGFDDFAKEIRSEFRDLIGD